MMNGKRSANRLTNSGNNLRARGRRQPSPGADSSSRDSGMGSNALDRNIGSIGHGNNKPKLALE